VLYCLHFRSELLFKKQPNWSWKSEVAIYVLLYLLVLPPTIFYYKSDIVNGDYPTYLFITEQYIPIIVVITPIMYLFRRLAARTNNRIEEEGFVILKGENKGDVLKIRQDLIIAVKSSDNYVEVSYLDAEELKKKLLRTTLKKIELEFSFLIRSHRSFLINTTHFKEWVKKDVARLGQIEVPVSKQYRDQISDLIRP